MSRAWASRERVQATLEHREPDRVPISFRISAAAYQQLRQYLGFRPDPQLSASDDQPAEIAPEVAQLMGIDLVWMEPQPVTIRQPAHAIPHQESDPEAALLARPQDLDWTKLAQRARYYYENTTLALAGRFGGSILAAAGALRGVERWAVELQEAPDYASQLLNHLTDIQIAHDELGLQAAGKYLSIFEMVEPAAAELIGRDSRPGGTAWDQVVLPALERRWQAARQAISRHAPQVKLMLTAPAAPLSLIACLAGCSVDVFGMLGSRIPAASLRFVKQQYGRQLSLVGGFAVSELASQHSEHQVRSAVRASLQALSPAGGYILAPDQPVRAAALPQNLVAMCDTAKVYGRYEVDAHSFDR